VFVPLKFTRWTSTRSVVCRSSSGAVRRHRGWSLVPPPSRLSSPAWDGDRLLESYHRETPAVNRRRGRLSPPPDLPRRSALVASPPGISRSRWRPGHGTPSTGIVIDGCINNGLRGHECVSASDSLRPARAWPGRLGPGG